MHSMLLKKNLRQVVVPPPVPVYFTSLRLGAIFLSTSLQFRDIATEGQYHGH